MRNEFWWGCRTSLENPNARQSNGIYKNNLQQLKRLNKTPNQTTGAAPRFLSRGLIKNINYIKSKTKET